MTSRRVLLLSGLMIALGVPVYPLAMAFPLPDSKPVHYREGFLKKHFDLDKNGSLNRYEWGLMMTQIKFGYRVPRNKRMMKFDLNGDHMLEPYEWENYRKSKKEKKIRILILGQTKALR